MSTLDELSVDSTADEHDRIQRAAEHVAREPAEALLESVTSAAVGGAR